MESTRGNQLLMVVVCGAIAVVVDDIDTMRDRVAAIGFIPGEDHDYEPGRRFYFHDADGIEYEAVQYD